MRGEVSVRVVFAVEEQRGESEVVVDRGWEAQVVDSQSGVGRDGAEDGWVVRRVLRRVGAGVRGQSEERFLAVW